jgi:ubiquinone biosynthesis O-methyltransferase
MSNQLKGLKILDVGCGGGILSEALARLGATVTSIDPSPKNIEVASNHSKCDPLTASIKYKCATVEKVAASGEKFDAVCTLEVVEHVEMPMSFLAACSSCLEEGGSLFVSTINRTYKSHLISILGAEYLTRLVPIGTHDWHKFITPDELNIMITAQGSNMNIRNTQGIVLTGINPFSGKMEWRLSSTDLDNNYIVHAVKAAKPN